MHHINYVIVHAHQMRGREQVRQKGGTAKMGHYWIKGTRLLVQEFRKTVI